MAASGTTGTRLPKMALVDTLVGTPPPALPLYNPREDNNDGDSGSGGGGGSGGGSGSGSDSLAVGGDGGGEVPLDVVASAEQQTAVVGDMLARLTDLRAAAVAWGEEARAALRERERELHAGGGGVVGSTRVIEALLARDVVHAVEVRGWVGGWVGG